MHKLDINRPVSSRYRSQSSTLHRHNSALINNLHSVKPAMKISPIYTFCTLFSLTLTTNAADCTAPNQQWYDLSAVQMMWSIRAWVCPNAWRQSITAGPDGAWCHKNGDLAGSYWGSWTISGMQSEQQCWVWKLFFLSLAPFSGASTIW
jgi:hypothetical protein